MKRLILIIIGMILINCGHTSLPFHYIHNVVYSDVPLRVIHIWVDVNFGSGDQISIDDSIRQWNYALNGCIRLEVESTKFDMDNEILKKASIDRNVWLIMRVESNYSNIPNSSISGARTLAWVNEIGGNYMWVVRDRVRNEWITGIVLHEIAHMLGAEHDEVYLMQPKFNWCDYRCVDRYTLMQVSRYQHIKVGNLNYCEYGSDSVMN